MVSGFSQTSPYYIIACARINAFRMVRPGNDAVLCNACVVFKDDSFARIHVVGRTDSAWRESLFAFEGCTFTDHLF